MTPADAPDDPPPRPPRGPLSFEAGEGEPLSPEEQERRWAHRRDPDLDAEPDQGAGHPPPPPRPSNQYAWLVALIGGVLVLAFTLNNLVNGDLGPPGIQPDKPIPPFATPLALSGLEGDANVAIADGQGRRGGRGACAVRGPDILNSCQLTEGAPAVLAFVATEDRACAAALDRLDRVARRFPQVRFAAVAARADRPGLRRLIRSRGWELPVGLDRDGAVFARYGVVDCPTLTFAYPGGVAMRTTLRPLGDRELVTTLTRLVAASERRGWKAPAA